ncbi:unnamed protein product [Cochlearia groenlandica]
MIKGGGGKSSSNYSADLMVCFPSRTHLSSLPHKSLSSPSPSFNHRHNPPPPPPHHRRNLSKLSLYGGGGGDRDIAEEPTSPKVTCVGQIKVRPRGGGGGGESKNWQSLMGEIEKIHRRRNNKSAESRFLGIKKDLLGFLTCLRDLSFDFRCFGTFPPVDAISDDEDEDEDESSGTVFSKWFMVLHEKQNEEECVGVKENALSDTETAIPPPNALLLMRCRSAPVKNWLETEDKKYKEETEEKTEETKKERVRKKKDLRSLMEEDNKKMDMVLMSYDTNYYKLSADIATETWVVGGIQDPLFRSRSSKK